MLASWQIHVASGPQFLRYDRVSKRHMKVGETASAFCKAMPLPQLSPGRQPWQNSTFLFS